MQINFKHVAATALAVAMSLSLASPALAEPVTTTESDGSLTVTGNELAGKNVFAVRMFTATVNKTTDSEGEEQTTSYARTDYELEDKWLPFFEEDIDYSEYNTDSDNDTDITKPVDAKEALAYMEWLKNGDEEQWAAFAEDAQDWLYEQGVIEVTGEPENRVVSIAAGWSDLAAMETATEVEPVEVNEAPRGNATFESLTSGYYVVFPEGGSTGISNRGTDAMLINIPTDHAGATWNIKSTYPTVDKKVDTNETEDDTHGDATDNGSAQVGDTVTFTLTSKVPDMSDYQDDGDKFYFAFNDTLSTGLQFVQKTPVPSSIDADDVIVTIGGKTVTGGYTVNLDGDGKVLKVEFEDLKDAAVEGGNIATGDPIVVTYKAMITKDAVVGNPALNTVKVEYSNNPTTDTKGSSTPDESKVYTYEISVNKYADSAVDLAGAKFKLTTDKEGSKAINLVATDAAQVDGTHNAYRVAEPGEEEASVTVFVTNSFGDIKISGLKVGIYYLHEIEAPAGYNKLKAPVKIEIAVSDDNYANATIKVDDETIDSNGTIVDVENKKGIELPETGSIGTIGLTVAGVAIVLLGVFAPRKKKKGNQE